MLSEWQRRKMIEHTRTYNESD